MNLRHHNQRISEHSLDVEIPSFPGSPRSVGCRHILTPNIEDVVLFLHHDEEFLTAAETGDVERLNELIMPSWRMANMLFDYGAMLLPRTTGMDTGLFLQFVMMCEPTKEEERILRLLVEKGAQVNDPEAPGGRQALHFAAMSNNCRLIRILLDLGANALLTNHRHETPRQVAITFKCRDALKLLGEYENTLNIGNNLST